MSQRYDHGGTGPHSTFVATGFPVNEAAALQMPIVPSLAQHGLGTEQPWVGHDGPGRQPRVQVVHLHFVDVRNHVVACLRVKKHEILPERRERRLGGDYVGPKAWVRGVACHAHVQRHTVYVVPVPLAGAAFEARVE